ncbi:MAG: sigma-70 family RNA polymerase sigma factor [Deltaproteobacteria bacterium]|nr:sigma-70 family RNA polymerase sigma factor [Deltaproteobacteria bacterium]MBI3076656.1 sigma-70 family RNA polymerase sigma factor [Deltaproteobacteria bacterium]
MGRRSREQQFEAATREHLAFLYRLAFRLTGARADAEDLVQETYLEAFRGFDGFQEGGNLRAWLARILIHNARDAWRRVERGPALLPLDGLADEDPSWLSQPGHPEHDLLQKERVEEVQQALATLPDEFRLALLLVHAEGLSYREAASVLGCPLGTLMSRIHRGRQLLRRRLGVALPGQREPERRAGPGGASDQGVVIDLAARMRRRQKG